MTTTTLKSILALFGAAVLIEVITLNNGAIILLMITALFLYEGIKRHRNSLLAIGLVALGITLFSLMTLRIAAVIIALYYIYFYYKKDTHKKAIFNETTDTSRVTSNPFFQTETDSETYAWRDVNMLRLGGKVVIDATQTVLPRGTSVITVQQLLGNVHIILPHDVPVRFVFSTFYGEAKLPTTTKKLKNATLHTTLPSEQNLREMVIHVSALVGDVEVSYA